MPSTTEISRIPEHRLRILPAVSATKEPKEVVETRLSIVIYADTYSHPNPLMHEMAEACDRARNLQFLICHLPEINLEKMILDNLGRGIALIVLPSGGASLFSRELMELIKSKDILTLSRPQNSEDIGRILKKAEKHFAS